jgi:hypothetical protein
MMYGFDLRDDGLLSDVRVRNIKQNPLHPTQDHPCRLVAPIINESGSVGGSLRVSHGKTVSVKSCTDPALEVM